ncbi:QVPTGV class sortase B protein-sorting domain-containing protein, partial [Streptococcus pyogenes]
VAVGGALYFVKKKNA